MAMMAMVSKLPPCDFCGKDAAYDGRTLKGPWAMMCVEHWMEYGCGKLGTGHGQRLVVRQAPPVPRGYVDGRPAAMTVGAVLEFKRRTAP